jgi:hypothetical protein
MDPKSIPCTERPAWKALVAHQQKIRDLHLRKLFADDPKRAERMTVEAVGLYLDYSKNRVTEVGCRAREAIGSAHYTRTREQGETYSCP